MTDELYSRLTTELATLEKIAKQYQENSVESQTVRKAAIALVFASTDKAEHFSEYLRNCDRKELNAKEKKFLKKFGIEVE